MYKIMHRIRERPLICRRRDAPWYDAYSIHGQQCTYVIETTSNGVEEFPYDLYINSECGKCVDQVREQTRVDFTTVEFCAFEVDPDDRQIICINCCYYTPGRFISFRLGLCGDCTMARGRTRSQFPAKMLLVSALLPWDIVRAIAWQM
jgi:hypothetical protein